MSGVNRGTITQYGSGRFRDGYTNPSQGRDTYLTTYDLAEELGSWIREHFPGVRALPHNESVRRWCKRWFGTLPPGRTGGRGAGYRIPPVYRYVARAWWQSVDEQVRAGSLHALIADPRPWLVVVGKFASTHYSKDEALERARQLLQGQAKYIHILYVGPMEDSND